jgi:hypothetical protein
MHSFSLPFSSQRLESGAAIVLALTLLLLSSLFLTAFGRTVSFQLQRAKALSAGRVHFERWEEESVTSTRRLPLSPEFETIPPPELPSLRVPLFRTSPNHIYYWPLDWEEMPCPKSESVSGSFSSPSYFELTTCLKLPPGDRLMIRNNLSIETLDVSGSLQLAVTGQVRIGELTLANYTALEVVSGGSLQIDTLKYGDDVEIRLNSITGRVHLSPHSCNPRISITVVGQNELDCNPKPLPTTRFKKARFIGEIEQAALVQALELR